MNTEKLTEVLKKHAAWLRGEHGGERADLRMADLRGADLREAKGILLLPVQDMRGYSFAHAVQCLDGEWRVYAGCRDFSIEEARAHWGSPDYPDRQRGDDYLYAVEWLVRRAEL